MSQHKDEESTSVVYEMLESHGKFYISLDDLIQNLFQIGPIERAKDFVKLKEQARKGQNG